MCVYQRHPRAYVALQTAQVLRVLGYPTLLAVADPNSGLNKKDVAF
jgi:hypothetical protein